MGRGLADFSSAARHFHATLRPHIAGQTWLLGAGRIAQTCPFAGSEAEVQHGITHANGLAATVEVFTATRRATRPNHGARHIGCWQREKDRSRL